MSQSDINAFEREYINAYVRWEYTPRWRLLARWYRKREWAIWLSAMAAEVKKEYKR